MTTVTAVKRAFVELRDEPEHGACDAFAAIARNPTALTMLANRLSDRGHAGNEAVRRNLGDLKRIAADLRFTAERVGAPGCSVRSEAADKLAALEWAIEQLTPPELAKPQERCSLEVGCDETGLCFAQANGQPDRCGRKP
jgi:hypothetical protein